MVYFNATSNGENVTLQSSLPNSTKKMIINIRSGKRLYGNLLCKTTRLGWINCNRSLEVNEEQTTLKVVEDTQALIDIKLVFKKRNTVIPLRKVNDHFAASGVPVGEKAFIVGLGQINNELYMAVKEITTDRNQEESLEFKLMTAGMIKKKLKGIN